MQIIDTHTHLYLEAFDAAGASEGKMEAVMTSECKIQLGRSFRGK